MATNRNPDNETLSAFRYDFLETLNIVTSVFGIHAFHRWMPERQIWRNQVLAALYDAQMFSCQYCKKELLIPYADTIVTKFKELFVDDEFRRSIDAATNTPSYFKDRIRQLRRLIAETARLG